MRLGLRWKILTFTAVPLVTLLVAALAMVHHEVSRRAYATIEEDLRRAAALLENVWAARGHELAVVGQVIAQDPKFFSVLTLPRGSEAEATVAGVARDFNALVEADVFEVLDAHGHLLASVGRWAADPASRERFAAPALSGRAVSGVLVEPGAHYEVAVLPAVVGGRVSGALVLGSRIGRDLAEQLRQLSRSEVTFLSQGAMTGTTIEAVDDREVLVREVRARATGSDRELLDGALLQLGARSHHYLTLVRRLPQTVARDQQYYVLQRSLDAETAFLRDIQSGLLQMGALAILAALVAAFVIAERITRPVQSLVRAAEDLERGRYDTPIGVESRDEIGTLARRFAGMRERLRDYIRGLQEASRLRSEFITIASHELRTPISIIQGYYELLERGDLGPLTPQQQMSVRGIGSSLQMLEGIATAATRLAQIEGDALKLDVQPCRVADLIETAVTRTTAAAKDRAVSLRADVESGIGEARLDGPRIIEALANLLGNGVRFTPDGGTVTAAARRIGDELVIDITDTGIGIAPEHHTAVLERGFGTRSSLNHHSSSRLEFNSSGLGLGLAIARGIIEAHGGTITLDSAVGRGSTFTTRLPLRSAALDEAA